MPCEPRLLWHTDRFCWGWGGGNEYIHRTPHRDCKSRIRIEASKKRIFLPSAHVLRILSLRTKSQPKVFLHKLGVPKPGCFKPGCLQFLRCCFAFVPGQALSTRPKFAIFDAVALFCALVRPFALFWGLAFALIWVLLCAFACFCVRPRFERPRFGTAE